VGRTAKLAIAGAFAATLVAVAGALIGPTGDQESVLWVAYGLVYAGLLGLCACWLVVGRDLRADSRSYSLRQVSLLLLAWAAPLALAPPLFSRDIFSYAAQGRLWVQHINPYHYGPAALGGGQFLRFVSPMWQTTHSPYGPLFTGIDATIVKLAGNHLVFALIGLRLLALAGVGLLVVYVPRLARTRGVEPTFALWLAALSPLALLHFVSGAHNDALMLGLLVAGLAVAAEGRPAAGLVLCTLAAAVKVPAAAGAVYVAVDWAMRARPRLRVAIAARATAIIAGTFGAITWLSGLGWGWIAAVVTPGRARSFLSPSTALGMAAGALTERMGLHHSYDAAIVVSRTAGTLVALGIAGYLFTRRHHLGEARSLGLTLLVVVALGPVVLPWYVLWGVVVLAAVGPGAALPALVWSGAGLALILMPDGTSWADAPMLAFLLATAVVVGRSLIGKRRAVVAGPVRVAA
jgi:hypothetical protein